MDCPDLWRCVADHLGVRAIGRLARAIPVDLSRSHERLLVPMADRMRVTFVEPYRTPRLGPRAGFIRERRQHTMAVSPRDLLARLRVHGRTLEASVFLWPACYTGPGQLETANQLHLVALELALIDLGDNGSLNMEAVAHANSHVYLVCSQMSSAEGRLYNVYLPHAVASLRTSVPDRLLTRLLTRIFLYVDKYYVPKSMRPNIAERIQELRTEGVSG